MPDEDLAHFDLTDERERWAAADLDDEIPTDEYTEELACL